MVGHDKGVASLQPHNPDQTPERIRALRAIVGVLKKGKKSRDAVDTYTHLLGQRDRAFVMEIVYGVLRHRDYLDHILRQFITRWRGLSDYTANNLRMALYQMLYMRVPDRAALFEAVEIEKSYNGKPSLVNAVLREIQRQGIGLNKIPFLPKDPIKALAIETSHPEWLIKRWWRRLGPEETKLLATKNNERSHLSLRFNTELDMVEASKRLDVAGIAHRVSEYLPCCLILPEGVNFQSLRATLEMPFSVQDEASQMVSLLLDPRPGMTVLDACAAPGGKTTHIASLMNDTGTIYAVDVDQRRLERLHENLNRLGLKSVIPLCGDLFGIEALIPIPNSGFDRVLLDAPCSALGVIRRRPDIKYRHREADLRVFAQRQLEMLTCLSRFLRVGGMLIYSVCSTEPEEGEEVLSSFLQKNGGFSNIVSPQGAFEDFIEDGRDGVVYYRTHPHRHNMDGFFVALIKRDR